MSTNTLLYKYLLFMLDTVSLSINGDIYLNLTYLNLNLKPYLHIHLPISGELGLASPVGIGGCPRWPWPGCRGRVVYALLACPHAYPLRIDKDIDDN